MTPFESMDLSEDELEQLALFAVGLAMAFIMVSLMLHLIEEWVIASDLADRRRIREILREMLEGGELEEEELEYPPAWEAAIVSTPRPLTSTVSR